MYVISHNLYASLAKKFMDLYNSQFDLGEDDLSIIGFPYEGKTRFIVLTGKSDELLVQVFSGAAQMNAFKENMEAHVGNGKCDTVYRFDFVQMEMAEPEELYDEEYNSYVKAEINVEDNVPMFRNFKSGHAIWVIDEFDAELALAGLDIVAALASRGTLPHQTFCQFVDGELVESYFFEQNQVITNDIEVSSNTPKLSFRRSGKWIMGTYYMPLPSKLSDQLRPVHELVCIVMDEDTEEVLHIIEAEPNKDHFVSFNESLYNMMRERKKRPRSVAFYGADDFEAFVGLFQYLDVEIYESSNYELLNDVWMRMEDDFLATLEMAMEEDSENKTLH